MALPGAPIPERARQILEDFDRRRSEGGADDFAALCRDHPEFADCLRVLRDARRDVDRLLPGPLAASGAPRGDPDDGDVSSGVLLEKLRRIGPRGTRYRSDGEIARGGMGVVKKVWDDELRRRLAMKTMLSHGVASGRGGSGSESRFLGRFLEEAQITGQLDHPGIVPVHELGLDAEGRVYYTMRLVQGDNLRTIFDRVRDGIEGWNQVRAIGVLLKVCEAMSYAHAKGVIHRDLKPANVMVGRFGEVYVMDWGLARVLGRPDRHDVRVRDGAMPPTSVVDTERNDARDLTPDSPLYTMDGDVVGTASYMSPEQANGQVDRLGPPSDVYAIGAMLYHLLSGQMPFVPADARLTPRTVLARLVEGPPRPLRELAPNAPAELMAICDKAMARRIEDRYAGMPALADDLRAYVEGRVVGAYESGLWAECRKWVRRNRALAAALAAAVLILVTAVVNWIVSDRQAAELERLARARNATAVAARLQGFRRDAADAEFLRRLNRPALEWWLETARTFVHDPAVAAGSLGAASDELARCRDLLSESRQRATPVADLPLTTEKVSDSLQDTLERKRQELLWRSRILALEPWLTDAEVVAQRVRYEFSSHPKILNNQVWSLVDPDNPEFGHEQLALRLAQEVMAAPVAEERVRGGRRDTLAWALYRVGRFDEALKEEELSVREQGVDVHNGFTTRSLSRMQEEVGYWRDGTFSGIRDEIAGEVEALERESAARPTFRFEEHSDRHWHEFLTGLEAELIDLQARLALAERASEAPDARPLWQHVIADIQGDPNYGIAKLTPQLDLLPLHRDPESGLWEFAHLPSGDPPIIGADGRLRLGHTTSLVFVLLPPGRLPPAPDGRRDIAGVTLEPYFLSKYEMTSRQWRRMSGPLRGNPWADGPLYPVRQVSWTDCNEVFDRVGGWLRLPSAAQWLHAAAGNTRTKFWTGDAPESLRGAENLIVDARDPPGNQRVRVGSLRPNPFGFHDMLGNLSEWCLDDDFDANGVFPLDLRAGDGLHRRAGSAQRVCVGASFLRVAPEPPRWIYGRVPDGREPDLGVRPARPLTR